MRVTILLDGSALRPVGGPEDEAITSVAGVAKAVRAALEEGGHEVRLAPLPAAPVARLSVAMELAREADALFNLAESLGRRATGEVEAGWLGALTGLPMTGAPPRALGLCLEKPIARAILRAEGIPVPEARVIRGPSASLAGLALPAIVKPAAEDASHGIDDGSVIRAIDDPRPVEVAARYGAALVEEYIEGRELQAALLGRAGEVPAILPLGEVDYSAVPASRPRILTYAAKWNEASPAYQTTPTIAAAPLEPAVEAALAEAARGAWRALGLGGYARVDFRVHAERGPFVIDVNPNPDLTPGAGFVRAARRAGIEYDKLILRILHLAAPA